ncbi:DUF4097 family beta strand repeat-containing protein [Actinoplanes utahensis]|uniref:DUF4097 domain-containing protein n=1 Tax=Actinoplanes utahensis TaxID=1869 RepID=A0A0A6XBM4_ACTUT|nr:DUF4097 family beta strand repeat-containing protein [Actinoplanes utahensis]KHD77512.1 hypothetical protein MB27_10410 [Actinoplanes utahensis]GIF32668.1 hypothetical protein Aut01nite_56540 [Actinoplanes utahensis]
MPNFNTPAAVAAVLDLPAGNIRIIAADRADSTVEVRPADAGKDRDVKAAEQVEIDYRDGVLRVTAPVRNQYFGASGAVEVTIQLPTGSRIEAKAATTDFRAVGRLGEVTVEAPQATVKIDEASGVRVTASAGDIAIGRLTGPAEISVEKGDIRIDEAVRGDLALTTTYGEVSVGVAAGVSATLDAGAAHGRVHNALRNTEGAGAPVTIKATNGYGDITARSL